MSASALAVMTEFSSLPELCRIEGDRICRGCGYNLRQRSVRREPRTNLLLIQCPECGGFDPASEAGGRSALWIAWLHRALLFIWIGSILLFAWIAGACFYASGFETARIAHTRQWTGNQYVLESRPLRDVWEIPFMGGVSAMLGVALGLLLVVFFPHWRRWAYPVPVALLTAIGGVIAVWDLAYYEVSGIAWVGVATWVAGAEIVAFLAGLFGIAFGRPIARLAARWLIPPAARGPLAYLWLVDGKTPPSTRRPTG